jgi:hypothetical protein
MKTIIPLSPIDHIFTGAGSYPIEFIFKFDGILDEAPLRKSLDEALTQFPVVGSKLVKLNDFSYGLEIDNEGCHFESVSSVHKYDEINQNHLFIDPVQSLENEPLTRIRLTQTPEGSVLGVSISHAIGDGFSYFYFLTSWAKLFHNQPIFPPFHGREILLPKINDGDKKLTSREILEDTGLFLGEKRMAFSRQSIKWETHQFPDSELKTMVDQCQKLSESRLSVNDVVTASLWKKYMTEWRKPDDPLQAYCCCPVDFRRIMPEFPRTYFGNAVSMATVSLDYPALAESGIPELAKLIRARVAGVNPDTVMKSLNSLELLRRQEGLQVNECIHVLHPRSGFLVTNLSKLPVNEIVFNCGPPSGCKILTTAVRGAVILPGENGIEARVCCPPEK